ncbi:MAG: 50S ribosomal protein L4 [Clostridia bacterium]|jgi:large subunit ribosomal protein L4|nr:50S ribosomal protein L4 [Clostridia bacterium]MDD3231868.1 50S ribosomal protein L4 [Clostridia bacterium]MDD3862382.1 50S ribosomal protein L4 [Clostridia bacterium]MDD4408471.1 50S ribosomal protein L4 [Clostridia bacterium]
MAKVKVYDMQAKEVGSLDLKEEIFDAPYNQAVIHQVVVAQNANQRQGTKSALTRSEVRGHTKKPWKQKHTGNARHGSRKSPIWKGGGVAFAPKPRDFSQKINKQVKYLAFVSALSQKIRQEEITVIDEIKTEGKTKEIANMLKAFDFDKKTLIVVGDDNANILQSSANIPNVEIVVADLLNVGQIVGNKNLIFSKNAINKIEEVRV